MRNKTTMDGNKAAAHAAYAFTENAAIYPITPSSAMAEYMEIWASEDRKNILGATVQTVEMQSESGAAGAVHGSLIAGTLASTFTSSQGLLLMIPEIYRLAGELLPGVIHVAARTVAAHALSIFGDHSDVYACRQTGAAILASSSVQETMDLGAAAHIAAIKGRLPFIHFFDGFRTSHEMQKIEVWDYDELYKLYDMDTLMDFRKNSLNPMHSKIMGSAQNPDIFFQNREASNQYYDRLPSIMQDTMDKINKTIGTDYHLFDYAGAYNAEHIIVAMGSVTDTIEETVRFLNDHDGKYGLIKVRLYRPFSTKHFLKAIPAGVKRITVLDRTKEPGSAGEPLYLDVIAALKDSNFDNIPVFSGRYGLSSKDTTPAQIKAVLENTSKRRFTVGIDDDVTHLSIPTSDFFLWLPNDIYECKFWGLGGDGTVSANKSTINIIGNNTDLNVQAYFEYDSKKSRGLTISHLRFGKSPIHAPYLIRQADFSACHNQTYMHKYPIVQEIKDGGCFLLSSGLNEDELESFLPGQVKRYIARRNIRFFIIDAISIGRETGLNGKISTILQAAFFKVTGILSEKTAVKLMKTAAEKAYGKKGDKIVKMNHLAIDIAIKSVREIPVPESWKKCVDDNLDHELLPDRPETLNYVQNVQKPIVKQQGDNLPVSAFLPYADGSFPPGTTAHERRNTAPKVPVWIPDNCIQCGFCSYVCPHAVIRPAVLDKIETSNAPAGMKALPMNASAEYGFSIIISETDCTGCGSCAAVCPGKKGNKALEMVIPSQKPEQQEFFDYGKNLSTKSDVLKKFSRYTIKGSQLRQPLLEFHGACSGCGETPYAKLATQLFGERMYIANATGCSSIWAHSSPSAAYTINSDSKGPAWSNSLFEDGAEFGFGMLMAAESQRKRLRKYVTNICSDENLPRDIQLAAAEYLATFDDGDENYSASERLIHQLETLPQMCKTKDSEKVLTEKEYLAKKSCWVFGGDGFAYDIGFGGLDHVLASGADINILIFDTEVYSNTGGQSSKATPLGAEAKFSSGGKTTPKKNLAAMMTTYENIYVAQVAMGADYNQTIKAFTEAEKYKGPSLIIAYSPCIAHSIKSGMGSAQQEEAAAVKCGYWQLFRFNPEKLKNGEVPLIIDSPTPTIDLEEFTSGELRFRSETDKFLERLRVDAIRRYNILKGISARYS